MAGVGDRSSETGRQELKALIPTVDLVSGDCLLGAHPSDPLLPAKLYLLKIPHTPNSSVLLAGAHTFKCLSV